MEWKDDIGTHGLTVLRVVQLDGEILDQEILHLLESQVKKVFQNFQAQALKWIPEINLVLRFILWKFTIHKNAATIGQSLFDVRYALWKENGYTPITTKEKLILGLSYIVGPWIHERIDHIFTYFDSYEHVTDKIRFFVKWLENFWRLASVINFLVFLNKGIYPTLLNRFLSLRHVYNRPQILRKLNFKFMNREILWHGYAEFIFFILPLVNVHRLKSVIKRLVGMGCSPSQLQKHVASNVKLSSMCPVCNSDPTQPYITDCGHLFCYICIKSNCLADPDFCCPLCNINIGHNIRPYRPSKPMNSLN